MDYLESLELKLLKDQLYNLYNFEKLLVNKIKLNLSTNKDVKINEFDIELNDYNLPNSKIELVDMINNMHHKNYKLNNINYLINFIINEKSYIFDSNTLLHKQNILEYYNKIFNNLYDTNNIDNIYDKRKKIVQSYHLINNYERDVSNIEEYINNTMSTLKELLRIFKSDLVHLAQTERIECIYRCKNVKDNVIDNVYESCEYGCELCLEKIIMYDCHKRKYLLNNHILNKRTANILSMSGDILMSIPITINTTIKEIKDIIKNKIKQEINPDIKKVSLVYNDTILSNYITSHRQPTNEIEVWPNYIENYVISYYDISAMEMTKNFNIIME